MLHPGDSFRLVCEADSGTDLQWVRGNDELLEPMAEGVSIRTAGELLVCLCECMKECMNKVASVDDFALGQNKTYNIFVIYTLAIGQLLI